MKIIKNHKKRFIICILTISIVMLCALAIFLINKTKPTPPEIEVLQIFGHEITIRSTLEYPEYYGKILDDERLVYCLNTENNPETCEWQNSNKFQFEHERTYYVYILNP